MNLRNKKNLSSNFCFQKKNIADSTRQRRTESWRVTFNGAMIDCNQAYAKMLGYTKKELRNLSVQELLPEKWHEQREKIVNKVLANWALYRFRKRIQAKGRLSFSSIR